MIKAPRLFVLLLLLGCSGGSSADRPFLTRTYQTAAGETAHYVLFVPPNRKPNERLPVILFLNGWGENGDDGLRQISNNFGGDMWRMRATFPFLAVCPQCRYNAEWTPGSANEQLALGVLDAAIGEFNGDPGRVAVTGASTGGTGALNIALANPDRFAAVVPISSSIHASPDKLARSGIAVWNFYNSGDSSTLVREAREARKQQLEAGNSPLVTEFQQGGHNSWDSAYSSAALYRWLLEQRRSRPASFGRFRFQSPQTILSEWTASDPAHWSAEGDDLVGAVGGDVAEIRSPLLERDWAVHFDAQLGPGQPVRVALIDSAGQRASLVAPLSRDGYVEWSFPGRPPLAGDPVAQRALRPGWNDVRVECLQGKLTVRFNGWVAFENVESSLGGPIQFALAASGENKDQRFRFVRLSQSAAGEAQP